MKEISPSASNTESRPAAEATGQAKPLTPLHIELLVHYFSSCEPFPRENSVIGEYRENLVENGLIRSTMQGGKFSISEKGQVFVKSMCATPLPKQRTIWVPGSEVLASQSPVDAEGK